MTKLENVTEENLDMSVLDDMLEIVATICQHSNQKITKDWLLDNIPANKLLGFVKFVFSGMTQLKDEGEAGSEDGKNSPSGT